MIGPNPKLFSEPTVFRETTTEFRINNNARSIHTASVRLLCYIDGLVQERRNSSVLVIEMRLSCTNPSTCYSLQHASLIRCSR